MIDFIKSRDDIVAGNHPITKEEAVNFAAIQAQVQLGDYKPEVHKPGVLQYALNATFDNLFLA